MTSPALRINPAPRLGLLHRARLNYADTLLLVAVVVVVTGVMVVTAMTIGKKSLWLDEAESAWNARHTLSGLLDIIVQRNAPQSAYFLLLHVWTKLGSGEAMLRLPSYVGAAAALGLAYLVGRRLLGHRAGLVTAGLLGTNAYFIQQAQEARSYGLLLAVALLSTYLLLKAESQPAALTCAAFTLTSVVAVYLHPLYVLVAASQGAAVLFLANRTARRRLLVSIFLVVVLSIPLFILVNSQHARGFLWNPPRPDTVSQVMLPLVRLAGGSAISLVFLAVASAAGLLLGGPPRWSKVLLLSWLLLPMAVLLTSSLTVQPIWLDRYLFVCLPPLTMLAASGIVQLRSGPVMVAALALAAVLSSANLIGWFQGDPKEGWREAATYVRAQLRPGDDVLILPENLTVAYGYYDPADVRFTESVQPDASPNPQLAGALMQHPRLWVVDDNCRLSEHGAAVTAAIGELFRPASTRKFEGLYCTIEVSEQIRG